MAPIDIHPKNQHYNFSVGPGLASRYVSVVSMFWISIASLIVRLMLEVRPSPLRVQTMFLPRDGSRGGRHRVSGVGDARNRAKREGLGLGDHHV